MALEINIRKARLTDSEFLLKIHNESVKRKFIDSTSIDKKNFNIWNQWFKKKLKSKEFIIFIGKNKYQHEFGYVSFDEILKSIFEVRIGNLPNFYGKGLGSLLLSKSLKKFLKIRKPKKIISIVKKIIFAHPNVSLKMVLRKKKSI